MEQQNNITKSRKGKHLTREERQQIETLRRAGLAARAIAELLGGRSARTIRRELARGTVDQMNSELTMRREYSYDVGQMKHDEYAKNKSRSLKIGSDHEFARYIEEKIGKEKMSPYAALQQAKNDGKEFVSSVCVKTLYNYIESGLFLHISKGGLPQIRVYAICGRLDVYFPKRSLCVPVLANVKTRSSFSIR